MGKNTKIICSVVPNGIEVDSANKQYLKLSVFLSPRLPDTGSLKEYYEILKWYDFIDFFRNNAQKLEFCFDKLNYDSSSKKYIKRNTPFHKTAIFDFNYLKKISDSQPPKSKINDPKFLWSCLFRPNTPVKGWILDEGDLKTNTVFLYDQEINEPNTAVRAASTSEMVGMRDKRLSDDNKAAREDIMSNVLDEEDIISKNKENQEFHRKMSILSSYPHILRACNWILDFKVELPPSGFMDTTKTEGYIIKLIGLDTLSEDFLALKSPDEQKWKLFINEIDFKTPWSYCKLDQSSNTFTYRYSEKYEQQYFKVENGYIIPHANNYNLCAEQFQKGVALGTMGDNIESFKNNNPNINASNFTDLTNYLKDSSQKHDEHSEGITIKVLVNKECDHPVKLALDCPPGTDIVLGKDQDIIEIDGKDNSQNNIDDYILFGHHLDAGYEIEVRKSGSGNYTSLCKRKADYLLDVSEYTQKKKFELLLKDFKDIGWISEVAAAGKSGKLYFSEELCRWNNWSLVCPQIGKHPQDEKNQEGFFEYNDLELANILPFDKMTPLRFDKDYEFRIKVVDICGNRQSDKKDLTKYSFKTKSIYERKEKIDEVALFFVEDAFKHNGNNKQLIDKYTGEEDGVIVVRSEGGDLGKISNNSSSRSISPPRCLYNLVEAEGVLDAYLNDNVNRKVIYNLAGYEKQEGKNEFFQNKNVIPFLTDPKVATLNFNSPILVNQNLSFNSVYLKRTFLGLKLIASNSTLMTCVDDSCNIEIEPGKIDELRVETTLGKPKAVTLIHALQKPMLFPKNLKTPSDWSMLEIADRKPIPNMNSSSDLNFNDTIDLTFKFKNESDDCEFPFSTSSEIILKMEYEEIFYAPTKNDGYDTEKRVKVMTFKNTANGSISDMKIAPLFYDGQSIKESLTDKYFKKFLHSFDDTKYRQVEYTLEGISRFKSFFPQNLENDFSYKQTIGTRIIKNSSKMNAPEIHSVVHLFECKDFAVNGSRAIIRTNNSFRIYFNDVWYQSGEGEKVAILYNHNDGSNQDSIEEKLENIVSSFGSDPATSTSLLNGLKDSNFDCNEFVKDINHLMLNHTPQKESDLIRRNDPINGEIHAAIFDLRFDVIRKKFFVDIKMNFSVEEIYSYMPFLKFAVTRYQKNSITELKLINGGFDYRFSPVTICPHLQVLPYRSVEIFDTKVENQAIIRIKHTALQLRKKEITSKFYFFGERENVSDNLTFTEKVSFAEIKNFEYIIDNVSAYQSILVEEYESYHTSDEDGYVLTLDDKINPREDMSKRLVFIGKIK